MHLTLPPRTLRLLVGAAVDAAGLAIVSALLFVWLVDLPIQPRFIVNAALGVGLAVMIVGLVASLHVTRRN